MTVKINLFQFVSTGLDHSCCCALKALYCIARPELNNYQLMNEAEYLMKNYGDLNGSCVSVFRLGSRVLQPETFHMRQ